MPSQPVKYKSQKKARYSRSSVRPAVVGARYIAVAPSELDVEEAPEETDGGTGGGSADPASFPVQPFCLGFGCGVLTLALVQLLVLLLLRTGTSPTRSRDGGRASGAGALHISATPAGSNASRPAAGASWVSTPVESSKEELPAGELSSTTARVVLSAHPLTAGGAENNPALFKPTPVRLPDKAVAHQMGDVVLSNDPGESQFMMYDVAGTMFKWIKEQPGERFVQEVFHRTLDRYCHRGLAPEEAWERAVVIDVGANTGFYGLLALAHGCAVVFVEAQPECNALITRSIEASGFSWEKVKMVKQPLGHAGQAGQVLAVQPRNHCDGRFPIGNYEGGDKSAYGAPASPEDVGRQEIPFLAVEDMLHAVGLATSNAIQLVKIDTEGNELQIVEGFLPMLRRQRVANLVIEVTPQWWGYAGYTKLQGSEIFGQLAGLGYSARFRRGKLLRGAAIQKSFVYTRVQDDVWLHRD